MHAPKLGLESDGLFLSHAGSLETAGDKLLGWDNEELLSGLGGSEDLWGYGWCSRLRSV
jgi:hypothetical protein